MNAQEILIDAYHTIDDRAKERDREGGERSMRATVMAFNALFGHNLTTTEGWEFMSILKKARSAGGAYKADDYLDDVAYCALAAECAGEDYGV
jgi:hypothetical protein